MLLHSSHDIMFLDWPLLAGIAGAMIHVLVGPDHLAAVLPFAVEHKKSSWKIGLSWGLGHLAGMLLIGVLFMLFKQFLPPIETVSTSSELLVGFVLVGIGIWAIYRIRNHNKVHQHPHYHENIGDFHIHSHEHNADHVHSHTHVKAVKSGMLGSFSVGVLHGFAGVAHFILFLPMLKFESALQSLNYIVGFGLGTVFAMTSFALLIGVFAFKTGQSKNSKLFTVIRYSAALIAVVVGVYWIMIS